jgi:prepilin-type N-terminal cleavage/methylation domain-containing protein
MRKRNGFTLIELLVVIAIIGVLLGLLVPAVQKVREAANRMKCQSNLRQIAIGIHNYHDTYHVIPRGGVASWDQNGNTWGWLALLLPFIEQDSLYRQANTPADPISAHPKEVALPIPIYLCPTDPMSNNGANTVDTSIGPGPATAYGYSNYNGVAGSNWGGDPDGVGWVPQGYIPVWSKQGTNSASWDGFANGDGMFPWRDVNGFLAGQGYLVPKPDLRSLRLTQITDGTSNTFMVGEVSPVLNVSCTWVHTTDSVATCAIPPNNKLYTSDPTNWTMVQSFRSFHTGGLNFAYADASVHFVVDSIALAVYRNLATIQGGEPDETP